MPVSRTRPTRKRPAASRVKAVEQETPADFDFDAFVGGFRRPTITKFLYQRADLVPRLSELDEIIGDLERRVDRMEQADETVERSVTEDDPLTRMQQRLNRLIGEFNDIAQEYEDSKIPFTFRIPDRKSDSQQTRAMMTADGVFDPNPPSIDTPEGEEYADIASLYSMSVTCTSHPMTPDQWKAFRETVGEAAWMTLFMGWLEGVKAAMPSVPFSQKPLPIPEPTTPSPE
jgi:hypothetical protein